MCTDKRIFVKQTFDRLLINSDHLSAHIPFGGSPKMKAIAVAQGERPMQKIKESPELRRIKQWYERIIRGETPTKTELQFHFRHYADQAEMLVRRVEDGQTWEDFVMGLDGAPVTLRRRLIKHLSRAGTMMV